MQNLKRTVAVVATSGVFALGLAAATAVPAQAATTGSSCKLSANWTVKFSAGYDQTGNSSYIRYVVMNSPGPIKQWRITIQDSRSTDRVTLPNPEPQTRVDVYKAYLLPKVHMEVWGGNGACSTYLYPYSV